MPVVPGVRAAISALAALTAPCDAFQNHHVTSKKEVRHAVAGSLGFNEVIWDWDDGTKDGWALADECRSAKPSFASSPQYQGQSNAMGVTGGFNYIVNSQNPGTGHDDTTGIFESPIFQLCAASRVQFKLAGGSSGGEVDPHSEVLCDGSQEVLQLEFQVDDKWVPLLSQTGDQSLGLRNFSWGYNGEFDAFIPCTTARLRAYDLGAGNWGRILIDDVILQNTLLGVATAAGDPHIQNVLGQRFEIRKPGGHTMLSIPRRAGPREAFIHVYADIRPVAADKECDGMFISQLVFSGKWLGDFGPLTFSAGRSPGLAVGDSSNLTIGELASMVPPSVLSLELPKTKVSDPSTANSHATGLVAVLTVGPKVHLKVAWVLEKVSRQDRLADSLWLSVSHLDSANSTIGGLLGTDDFFEASRPPLECLQGARRHSKGSSMMISPSVPGYGAASASMKATGAGPHLQRSIN